jgi:hypothetical protein
MGQFSQHIEHIDSEHSEYIVYVDESGDHALAPLDPHYPIFVLAFCIFEKRHYAALAVPRLAQLKLRYFGHDRVVLHEHDIRKSKGDFRILRRADLRAAFLRDLDALIADVPFTIVASCIRKRAFVEQHGAAFNPYHVALQAGLAQVYRFLCERDQQRAVTHVVCERRGPREDRALAQEFRRICLGGTGPKPDRGAELGAALRLIMASKTTSICGLQLADLVARPIGRHLLQPDEPGRAHALLEPKLRRSPDGDVHGWGLICQP